MRSGKTILAMALVACLLSGCKSKTANDANLQSAQATQTAQPGQAAQPVASGSASPSEGLPAQAAQPTAQVTTPAPPPPPPPPPIVIPAGTMVTVRLRQELSSKTNSQGDPFDATVASPVVVDGKTVIPAGTSARGVVSSVQKAGRFKGAATLDVKLRSVTMHSKVYKISTMSMNQTSKGKGKRTAAMVGGGAGGGALIGGLAGGGKGAAIGALVGAGAGTAGAGLTGDRNITMPSETAIGFQLKSALTIPNDGPAN